MSEGDSTRLDSVGGSACRSTAYRVTEARGAGLAATRAWMDREFWDLSMDLLAVASTSGFLTAVSPSWSVAVGWSSDELTSRPFIDFVHPDDVALTLAESSALGTAGHKTVLFENRYRTKSGQYRWLSWNARRSEDGSAIYCVTRDVTDAHESSAQFRDITTRLAQREQMLSGIIENSTSLVYVKDLAGKYLIYNQSFATAFALDERAADEGMTGLEVLLGRDDTWLDPSLQPLWRANDVRTATGAYFVEEWSEHPDRGRCTYDTWKFPLIDAVGDVYATCGVSTETTERVRLIEQLGQAEELLSGAFEHSPIGKALVGTDDQIMRANAALGSIVGRDAASLVGTTMAELIAPEFIAADAAGIQELATGTSFAREVELVHLSGDRVWIQASTSAVRRPDGEVQYFITQIQDISQRRLLEDELRHVADHDSLTGLRNRRVFEEDLVSQVARCQRYGEHAALLVVDLDGFKVVNDRHGHRAGDDILKAVSAALTRRLRPSDQVARLGGDEFAVLLPHVTTDEAHLIAASLTSIIAATWVVTHGERISVGASVGVAMINNRTVDAMSVQAAADAAMYAAKRTSSTTPAKRAVVSRGLRPGLDAGAVQPDQLA